jgi:hypothetical protein
MTYVFNLTVLATLASPALTYVLYDSYLSTVRRNAAVRWLRALINYSVDTKDGDWNELLAYFQNSPWHDQYSQVMGIVSGGLRPLSVIPMAYRAFIAALFSSASWVRPRSNFDVFIVALFGGILFGTYGICFGAVAAFCCSSNHRNVRDAMNFLLDIEPADIVAGYVFFKICRKFFAAVGLSEDEHKLEVLESTISPKEGTLYTRLSKLADFIVASSTSVVMATSLVLGLDRSLRHLGVSPMSDKQKRILIVTFTFIIFVAKDTKKLSMIVEAPTEKKEKKSGFSLWSSPTKSESPSSSKASPFGFDPEAYKQKYQNPHKEAKAWGDYLKSWVNSTSGSLPKEGKPTRKFRNGNKVVYAEEPENVPDGFYEVTPGLKLEGGGGKGKNKGAGRGAIKVSLKAGKKVHKGKKNSLIYYIDEEEEADPRDLRVHYFDDYDKVEIELDDVPTGNGYSLDTVDEFDYEDGDIRATIRNIRTGKIYKARIEYEPDPAEDYGYDYGVGGNWYESASAGYIRETLRRAQLESQVGNVPRVSDMLSFIEKRALSDKQKFVPQSEGKQTLVKVESKQPPDSKGKGKQKKKKQAGKRLESVVGNPSIDTNFIKVCEVVVESDGKDVVNGVATLLHASNQVVFLTARHVVDAQTKVRVKFAERVFEAEAIKYVGKLDVAYIWCKIPPDFDRKHFKYRFKTGLCVNVSKGYIALPGGRVVGVNLHSSGSHNGDTTVGCSGAPVIAVKDDNGNFAIVGVHVAGGTNANRFVPFDANFFSFPENSFLFEGMVSKEVRALRTN